MTYYRVLPGCRWPRCCELCYTRSLIHQVHRASIKLWLGRALQQGLSSGCCSLRSVLVNIRSASILHAKQIYPVSVYIRELSGQGGIGGPNGKRVLRSRILENTTRYNTTIYEAPWYTVQYNRIRRSRVHRLTSEIKITQTLGRTSAPISSKTWRAHKLRMAFLFSVSLPVFEKIHRL